jgi:hypothetical protein
MKGFPQISQMNADKPNALTCAYQRDLREIKLFQALQVRQTLRHLLHRM